MRYWWEIWLFQRILEQSLQWACRLGRGAKLGSSLLFRWRRMRYRGKGAFAVLVTMKGLGSHKACLASFL